MAEEKTEEKKEKRVASFTTPIIVALLVVVAFLAGMFWTKRGVRESEKAPEEVAQTSPAPGEEAVLGELTSTVGRFQVTEEEVCQEEGKPIIYFFGSKTCPHCNWEHPIFEKTTDKFSGLISFHNNMDQLETDLEVFQRYSQVNQGGIPFLVLGCRYVRVGSGENFGEEEEESYLTALICKLTEGEPKAVCDEVADLVEEIE